ncbi:hypothetical protein CC2G_011391 [Coprinopsis cinerea AmutBmut pab1-1]|nr:hypothetical protein CC2G_011391 [Coprinopsis cinerea AmutBmut pab1-1]
MRDVENANSALSRFGNLKTSAPPIPTPCIGLVFGILLADKLGVEGPLKNED